MTEAGVAECKHSPTMFGVVPEKNVTFCIDTSGSMYVGLEAVKEDLIETLSKKAVSHPEALFNLVEFNSEVTQWADKMVRCTPETVKVAESWIKDLRPKTGTNTQDALLTALSDPDCDAVYLVTDGLPDQYPDDILDHVGYAGQGRPVHCIYLAAHNIDTAASDFLEDLATETYGSFHIVTLTNHGCIEKITPVLAVDHTRKRVIKTINGTIRPNDKACSVSTTLQVDPEYGLSVTPRVWFANSPLWYPYIYPYYYSFPHRFYPQPWGRYRPARGWLKAQEEILDQFDNPSYSPSAGALLVGKKVLARNNTDGYFYLSSVQSQILDAKFLVGFGPRQHGKFQDTIYQETWVHDIISYEDAKRHAINTGDKVLAAWEPDVERFCPGTVITGHEKRQAEGPDADQKITVTFSNGKTETVPLDTAVWIPVPLFERLDLELKMPAGIRQSLEEQDHYPQENLPGYPTSGPVANPPAYKPAPAVDFIYDPILLGHGVYRHPDYTPLYPIFYKRRENEVSSAVKCEDLDSAIPGTDMTHKELEGKVRSQLEEHLGNAQGRSGVKNNSQSMRDRVAEIRKSHEEMKRICEEIKEREADIRKLADDVLQKKTQSAEEESEGLKKKRLLLEEIRKKEKELEILLREERGEEERIRQENERDPVLRRHGEWFTGLETGEKQHMPQLEKERKEREKQLDQARLLQRDRRGENSLRKTVSFKDEVDPYHYDRGYDSGRGSSPELGTSDDYPDTLTSEYRYADSLPKQYRHSDMLPPDYRHVDRSPRYHDNVPRYADTLPPEYRVLHRQKHSAKGKKKEQRPPWRYWRREPSPSHRSTRKSSPGPFRETLLQAPLEVRDRSAGSEKLEWPSSSFKYVDTFAKHNYNNSVGQLMKPVPQPPSQPKQWTFPGSNVGVILGVRERVNPQPEDLRLERRRLRVLVRQAEYTEKILEGEKMQGLMDDQHRQRILAQIQREKDRQSEDLQAIQKTFLAKQMMNHELRQKLSANTHYEHERELRRVAALRAKREEREKAQAEKAQEQQDKLDRIQEAKVQRSQMRWDEVHNRLEEKEKTEASIEQHRRAAKINRIQHFRNLEEIGQQTKDLRVGVTNQHLALYRSQVLP